MINTVVGGAPQNGATPNNQANQAQAPVRPEVASNAALFAKIEDLVSQHRDSEISQLLNDKKVADKLEACLLYYKVEESSDKIENDINGLALQFAKKEQVSKNMKDMVLKPFAIACSLEANTAFQLLDTYFIGDYGKFYHFEAVNKRIADFLNQVQQQLPQGGAYMMQQQQREQQYQTYNAEIQRIASKIVTAVKKFYLEERMCLIRCLISLFGFMSRPGSPPNLKEFIQDKLIKKDLMLNLAKSLLRCQRAHQNEFRRYFDEDSSRAAQESLTTAIQVEQIHILKLLFSTFYKFEKVVKGPVVDLVIEYLIQSCQLSYHTGHQMSNDPTYSANESIIAGLTQLVCFSMLQLHTNLINQGKLEPVVTPKTASTAWGKLMNPDNLSQVTWPIVLAIASEAQMAKINDQALSKMLKSLEESRNHLVAMNELLRSEVFVSDSLQSMNDAFYLVIYSWLIRAHKLFDEMNLQDEVDQVQMFTLSVLRNPEIIKMIWAKLDDLDCSMKDVSEALEIFKGFLEKPTRNPQMFLSLMLALSGKKNEPKGTSVLYMLEKSKVDGDGSNSNLLAELIAYLSCQMVPLENQRLSEEEFGMINSILILFAKVMKQEPLQYTHLNDVYMEVSEMDKDGKLALIFERSESIRNRGRPSIGGAQNYSSYQIQFEPGNHPFLRLLIRALHGLMAINFEFCRKAVIHLMDALSTLYDKDELFLKQEIMLMLSELVNHSVGESMIVTYFGSIVIEAESSLQNYKATESFLRFLCKIVKSPYPQECLVSVDNRGFQDSLFVQAVQKTYLECMEKYFYVKFADAASMGNFTTRCLKLTRLLLSHFLEVPQSQKAPLCEPIPRFDMLLEFAMTILNQFSVEQICIKTLELVQVEERKPNGTVTTRFENKFIHEALHSENSSLNSTSKLLKMANEAVLLLNTLLKLAMVDDTAIGVGEGQASRASSGAFQSSRSQLQDWTSKRCQYIRELRCVQQFRSYILDPSRTLQSVQSVSYGHATNLTLQSIVAFYILPSSRIQMAQLKTTALDHLTLTCQLWQHFMVEAVRPDLYQLLQGLGSLAQIEHMFFQQLVDAFSDKIWTLSQCLAYLDLMIVTAQSQPRFLEMLLKEEQSKKRALAKLAHAAIGIIQNRDVNYGVVQKEQKLQIKFKFTALLSILAKKRLCQEFVTYENGLFLKCIYKNVIEDECLKQAMNEKIQLDGTFLKPVIVDEEQDFHRAAIEFNYNSRIARNQCLAKIITVFYLQLLVSEFSRDPEQPHIRALLAQVFTNETFAALSINYGQICPDVHQLMTYTRNLNEILQEHDQRDQQEQRQLHDVILGSGIARMQDQSSSPLHSATNSVFLKGSLCIDLQKAVEKKHLADYIVSPSTDLHTTKHNLGQLGSSFYVSTKELEYALRQECYQNRALIGQTVSIYSQFNVALSVMLSDHILLKAKHDFMVSVGKISLRDTQGSSCKADQLVPMSFLPLIDKHVPLATDSDNFKKFSAQLTNTMIKHVKTILSQIQERKRRQVQHENNQNNQSMPQNIFLSRLDQDLLNQLVFDLGVISSQVSATSGSLIVSIKGDLQSLVQQEILMHMGNLIDIESCLHGTDMVAQELKGFNGVQTATADPARATSAIQDSEKQRYEMFIQLVTQCFQLCIRLKQDEMVDEHNRFGLDKGHQRSHILEQQRLEDAYIRVLTKVLDGMRRNYCFLKGLKVFVLAVQLIDGTSQRSGGLSGLMKKQDDQPMRVIISKLLDKDVTAEEITTILQLLTNYSMTREGAIHLSKMKILETLFKANIMTRLNEQDLYVSKQLKNQQGQKSMQQIRNPSHVHWCQVLILMRTLNDTLLENPQVEHEGYFSDLITQMHHFKSRIPKVLHIGLSLAHSETAQTDQLGNRSILSMALLEEIELVCAVMQQVFEHADYWAQLNFNDYAELKDYMLFAMAKLLQHCNTEAIIPASVTEQHLAKVTQSVIENKQTNLLAGNLADSHSAEKTGFQLKAEVCLQKTFLSVTCSLLNILLLSKKLQQQGKVALSGTGMDLLETWNLQGSTRHHTFSQSAPSQSAMGQRASGVFSDAQLSNNMGNDPIICVAYNVIRGCQERMMRRFIEVKSLYERKQVQSLYKYLQSVFQHDEWVMKEYSGGFNAHMFADVEGVEELLESTEVALQVSAQVTALLLERVRETTSEQRFANYSVGPSAQMATYTDEQQVVFMANDLIKYIKDTEREVKDSSGGGHSSSGGIGLLGRSKDDAGGKDPKEVDGAYLEKLLSYVAIVKDDPGVGPRHQQYQ